MLGSSFSSTSPLCCCPFILQPNLQPNFKLISNPLHVSPRRAAFTVLKEDISARAFACFFFEFGLCVSVWSACREPEPSGLPASFAYLVLTVINIYDCGRNRYEYSFLPSGRGRVEPLRFQISWTGDLSSAFHVVDEALDRPLGAIRTCFITFALLIWYPCLMCTVVAQQRLRDAATDGGKINNNFFWGQRPWDDCVMSSYPSNTDASFSPCGKSS